MSLMQKTKAELVALIASERDASTERDAEHGVRLAIAEATVERLTEQLALQSDEQETGLGDGTNWTERLVTALRPFANEAVLKAVDIRCMRPSEGVDIGVRVEVLRSACELIAEYEA